MEEGYSEGEYAPCGTYPVEKLEGISRPSNSYWRATWTAYLEKATSARVPCLGFMPAIPAIRK
jgi:hypothetical protein